MDPDANLAEMRQLAKSDLSEFNEDIHRLAELVLALDEWILRGGFLPKAWRDTVGGHYYGMENDHVV